MEFEWVCHPEAEDLLLGFLSLATEASQMIQMLEEDLQSKTSTRLFDWVDHFIVHHTEAIERSLARTGFVEVSREEGYAVYQHPGAQLPGVVVYDEVGAASAGVAVKVESIADFLMVRGLDRQVEGAPYAGYRRCCVYTENQVALWVVERRGSRSMEPVEAGAEWIEAYTYARELWQARPRCGQDEEGMVRAAMDLAREMVDMVGRHSAGYIVLEVERAYWQSRNRAAQVQKNRQDRLGMGWANHDHHTFRSSRRYFTDLVALFEVLGFQCREKFYAGKEAGWGAQVMENASLGAVLFLDLDLTPDEVHIDFAHEGLPELPVCHTVGLWCGLHGDSILQGGMHHLEAQFIFEGLVEDLARYGVDMMAPFSSFEYLKQAFTEGERWPVSHERIQKLLDEGKISGAQAESFAESGALGSHLENLQRRAGYKGFNQKNVSDILQRTDPRLAARR